jgi:hypothetical protein
VLLDQKLVHLVDGCSEHGPICLLFELILVIHTNTSKWMLLGSEATLPNNEKNLKAQEPKPKLAHE